MTENKTRTTITLDSRFFEEIKLQAKEENRSINLFFVNVLQKYMKEHRVKSPVKVKTDQDTRPDSPRIRPAKATNDDDLIS